MSAVFAEWQPRYADHNIATFPVTPDKVPAVKGYLKVGLNGSDQLAMKFPANDAFGLACRRNRITVLDVDTRDERVLADGLARHGQTPFIVRTGSGNFQAWYRHGGEKRRVRPDPEKPIDILGNGFVVAPPSIGAKGQYQLIQGTLDDLDRLPKMRHPVVELVAKDQPERVTGKVLQAERITASPEPAPAIAPKDAKRNDTLWRYCMKVARSCTRLENLMEAAVEYNNSEFYRPLSADEVLKIVASAWGYECEGKNRFGYGPRLVLDVTVVDDLAADDPSAYALLSILRRHHAGSPNFVLSRAMADSLGWTMPRFLSARNVLIKRGLIKCVHVGGRGKNDPPIYRFPS